MISVVMAISGTARRAAATSRANASGVVLRAMRRRVAAQPDCSGRCRWRHRRGSSPQPEESWSQIPGLERGQAQAGHSRSDPGCAPPGGGGARRAKVLPPRTQVYAGEHDLPGPAAARMSASISRDGRLRPSPRARVVTQNVQRLSQPSCTLMKARVRRRAPGSGWRSTGASDDSKVESGGRSAAGRAPGDLFRLGTTRLTPGRAAASAGLRVDQQPVTTIWRTPGAAGWRIFWRKSEAAAAGDRAGVDHRQVGLFGGGDQGVPGEAELAGISFDLGLVQPAADRVQVDLHG